MQKIEKKSIKMDYIMIQAEFILTCKREGKRQAATAG